MSQSKHLLISFLATWFTRLVMEISNSSITISASDLGISKLSTFENCLFCLSAIKTSNRPRNTSRDSSGNKSITISSGLVASYFSNATIEDSANTAGPLTPLCVNKKGPVKCGERSRLAVIVAFSNDKPEILAGQACLAKNAFRLGASGVMVCPSDIAKA